MRLRILLLPLAAAAALLAGCATANPSTPPTPTSNGVEALSAQEILTKATGALDAAKSYRLTGVFVDDGDKAELEMTVAGDNAKISIKSDIMNFEAVRFGGQTYLKADDLWEPLISLAVKDEAQRALAIAMIKGKYVTVPADQQTMQKLVPKASEILEPEAGTFTKGAATTIDGKPVITLTDAKGNKLYVATTGEPYPVRLESATGETVNVVDIGVEAAVTAPPAAEVVDVSKFGDIGL
jgi:hypothetical protein